MDRIEAMQAFVAVADLRGFASAARKLGLSASGVTRLIAALEDRLGARLLQRTTRSVALTDARARYLERARQIRAGGIWASPCRSGDVAIPEALSGSGSRAAAVGSHDQSGGGGRRRCGEDR